MLLFPKPTYAECKYSFHFQHKLSTYQQHILNVLKAMLIFIFKSYIFTATLPSWSSQMVMAEQIFASNAPCSNNFVLPFGSQLDA